MIQEDNIDTEDIEGENLDWLQNMDIYETLDASGMESIGFREFCAYILLLSSL